MLWYDDEKMLSGSPEILVCLKNTDLEEFIKDSRGFEKVLLNKNVLFLKDNDKKWSKFGILGKLPKTKDIFLKSPYDPDKYFPSDDFIEECTRQRADMFTKVCIALGAKKIKFLDGIEGESEEKEENEWRDRYGGKTEFSGDIKIPQITASLDLLHGLNIFFEKKEIFEKKRSFTAKCISEAHLSGGDRNIERAKKYIQSNPDVNLKRFVETVEETVINGNELTRYSYEFSLGTTHEIKSKASSLLEFGTEITAGVKAHLCVTKKGGEAKILQEQNFERWLNRSSSESNKTKKILSLEVEF